jgi:hypothetical protein
VKKKIDFAKVSLEELAAIVAQQLKDHTIDSVLVGGACVSIYSHNLYQSYDLDFVTYENIKKIKEVLNELNFQQSGKHFTHPDCKYLIEFVSPPVSIGDEPISQFEYRNTPLGTIKMLTPTDSVKDRLASFYHWNDEQSLDQALAICKNVPKTKINFKEVKRWSEKEGFTQKYEVFIKKHKMNRK